MDKKDRREKVQIKVMKGNRARKSQNTSHTHTHTYTHTHTHNQKPRGSSVKIEKLPYLLLKVEKN